jgi:hypothetical protein
MPTPRHAQRLRRLHVSPRRVGTPGFPGAPLTEPDLWASHPALRVEEVGDGRCCTEHPWLRAGRAGPRSSTAFTSAIQLQRELHRVDAPNAVVEGLPVRVQTEEPLARKIRVREASAYGASLSESPVIPPVCVDVYVCQRRWYSKLPQLVDDVPPSLPLLQQNGAQTAAEMFVDSSKPPAVPCAANREVP